MAISSGQVVVGVTATFICGKDDDGANIILKASGQGDVYLGKSNVTTETGFELDNGASIDLFIGPDEDLYGIVEEGTVKVYYLATLNK